MSLYDLQWRQYETQIATRSAEQSECLKKTALLITGPQTTKSPAQVGACNAMSVCSLPRRLAVYASAHCVPSKLLTQVLGGAGSHEASPVHSRNGSPQRQQIAPADTSGQHNACCRSKKCCFATTLMTAAKTKPVHSRSKCTGFIIPTKSYSSP